ncbi:hypothetical protein XENOCAPTIV_004412 [Xenoophorus captivus]|uniref:GDNF/GAS1 domain-containing protein n=1 Tax=Xenoophorus captivus TaxID=1517983 RepID=A0ABV0R6T0_9TELE
MRCQCSSLALLLWLLVALDAQLMCWHAILMCHGEPECELAYNQYLASCEGNIRGTRRQCPSHCIQALIRLNNTRSGPDLETCDCAQDQNCLSAKRAIEPCLPRRHPSDGCMEARERCEEDSSCHASLTAYLSYCGQLFNGKRCSSMCKATIQQMLLIPNGMLLNRCVCDGVERPFCEVVKENMSKLCSIGDHTLVFLWLCFYGYYFEKMDSPLACLDLSMKDMGDIFLWEYKLHVMLGLAYIAQKLRALSGVFSERKHFENQTLSIVF